MLCDYITSIAWATPLCDPVLFTLPHWDNYWVLPWRHERDLSGAQKTLIPEKRKKNEGSSLRGLVLLQTFWVCELDEWCVLLSLTNTSSWLLPKSSCSSFTRKDRELQSHSVCNIQNTPMHNTFLSYPFEISLISFEAQWTSHWIFHLESAGSVFSFTRKLSAVPKQTSKRPKETLTYVGKDFSRFSLSSRVTRLAKLEHRKCDKLERQNEKRWRANTEVC